MLKRSQQKRITKEAIVLRHMRLTRKLSLNKAGARIGITGSAIAHIEGGRMEVSRARIRTMVDAYEYTMEDYLELFSGSEVPVHLRDECMSIVRQLDDAKLQAVHTLLTTMLPPGTTRGAQNPSQARLKA